VVGRFDGIEDRRRVWQLAHARQCRHQAGAYRRRGGFGDLESAYQLDKLAVLFDADARPADDPTID
jgi:hypothetical protein